MSSIKVGSTVQAILFQHDNFSGWAAAFGNGAAVNLSSVDSDQISSIKVVSTIGPLKYQSSQQLTIDRNWTDSAQGLARNGSITYITHNSPEETLWRFPSGWNPDSTASCTGSTACNFMPEVLENLGYNHFGDPEYFDGYVFVPVEGGGQQPAIALFDADNLQFLAFDLLYRQSSNAGWAAIKGGRLWSSDRAIKNTLSNRLWSYALDANNRCAPEQYDPNDSSCWMLSNETSHDLFRCNGTAVDLDHVQGGDFGSGNQLYLSNGLDDCSGGGDGQGLRVFDSTSGALLANASGPYAFSTLHGQFIAQASCDWPESEEMEGLDIQGTDLSFFVLDNEAWGGDHIFWKHYTAS